MLSFQNVTKDFRLDEATTITPVRNVSLKIEDGEFIVVVGRSGTGKTTLLNLAAGLVKPTSGRVTIDGSDLKTMSQRELSALRSRQIGFVFQFPSLLPALTVKDNICLPAMFLDRSAGDGVVGRAEGLLKTFGLGGKMGVFPRQLSAGETKRVVLARSLVNRPQLVMADEPTSDLDERTEKEVIEILREVNSRGVTFLIVTHNLGLIPFATRAFEMENGALRPITKSSG